MKHLIRLSCVTTPKADSKVYEQMFGTDRKSVV